jgi:4-alpha-glucanotransferase
MDRMEEVAELAARWGIEREFFDARGCLRQADPETVRRIAASLSADGHGAAPSTPNAISSPLPPVRAYQGDGDSRLWLLAIQLYSVRSSTNWGHGDFTDLAALIALAAEIGAAGIGLNPLHALFADRAEQASPYAPNSRLFLNPLYIDVTAAPGFPGLAEMGVVDEVSRLQSTRMVDYAAVAQLKMRALRAAYRGFRKQLDVTPDFAEFRRERGAALERFAAFETLRPRFADMAWWDWPPEWREPSEHALAALRQTSDDEIGFQEFVQWVADRQLRRCDELARSLHLQIGLYIDVAVGVDPAGADAWAGQGMLLNDVSIGAPPDILNTAGQEWGVTTYNPHRLVEDDFAPLRDMLCEAMRYAGAVRLDHILGLKRLYVIPRGFGAAQGTYLHCPFDAMLAAVADESRKQRSIVIGEDLGTVPEGFRETVSQWGIWTYLVMLFEREHDGSFRAPDRYPVNAVATFSTHDLATFGGWLSGHDLRVKRDIGIDPGEADDERRHAVAALEEAKRRYGFEGDGFVPIARYLAATPSRLVVISVEDVLMIEDQVNVPGTIHEHANWRRRLPVTIEELAKDGRLHQVADVMMQAGRIKPPAPVHAPRGR